ncbi:MAG: DsbA family protein [Actinomycetes bacterium]
MAASSDPATVVVYTDVACPWSTLALHRFYAARSELGYDDVVRVEHRLFLLEDVNRAPTPKRGIEAEIPVVGALDPGLGLKPWQQEPSAWPVTSLLANEAVHAARQQSLEAAEDLDMALRLAFFRDSRCISMLHEVVAVAKECDAVDAEALRAALDDGRARGPMMAQYRAERDDVQGSPHFVLPDGENMVNPGVRMHWEGDPEAGYPVVDSDDPTVYQDLLRQVATTGQSSASR